MTFWHLWHSWHCDILDHLWISSQLQVRSSGLPQTLLHYQSSISDLNSACRWLLDTTHSLHIIIVSQVLLFVSCPPWSTFLHSFLTPSASTPRESQTPCNHYTYTAEDNSLCNLPCWKLENLRIPLEKSETPGIQPGPSSCLTDCITCAQHCHPCYIDITTSIFSHYYDVSTSTVHILFIFCLILMLLAPFYRSSLGLRSWNINRVLINIHHIFYTLTPSLFHAEKPTYHYSPLYDVFSFLVIFHPYS